MQATSVRFVSLVEWFLAAIVLVAAVGLVSIVLRELRTLNAATAVHAGQTLPDAPVPAAIPPRVVSVPMLLLPDGSALRVGDRLEAVTGRLAAASELRPLSVEITPTGERITRFYEYGGARFVLVFERFNPSGESRIAAIYLQ